MLGRVCSFPSSNYLGREKNCRPHIGREGVKRLYRFIKYYFILLVRVLFLVWACVLHLITLMCFSSSSNERERDKRSILYFGKIFIYTIIQRIQPYIGILNSSSKFYFTSNPCYGSPFGCLGGEYKRNWMKPS